MDPRSLPPACAVRILHLSHTHKGKSLLLERMSYCSSGLRDMRTAEEMDEPFDCKWSGSAKFCILNGKSPNSLPPTCLPRNYACTRDHIHHSSSPPEEYDLEISLGKLSSPIDKSYKSLYWVSLWYNAAHQSKSSAPAQNACTWFLEFQF